MDDYVGIEEQAPLTTSLWDYLSKTKKGGSSWNGGLEGQSNPYHFVSLVDYVCLNPLHDENETHERMFLYALTLVDVGFNMKVSAAVLFF